MFFKQNTMNDTHDVPTKKLGICSSDFSQSVGAGAIVLICQNTVVTPLYNHDTHLKKRNLCSLHWGTMQNVSPLRSLSHMLLCQSSFHLVLLGGLYVALSYSLLDRNFMTIHYLRLCLRQIESASR